MQKMRKLGGAILQSRLQLNEDIIDVDITREDEDIIEHVPQTETIHLIAKLLNERGMNAGDSEPLLWIMLSSIYRILRKRHGSAIDDIMHLIDDHKEGFVQF